MNAEPLPVRLLREALRRTSAAISGRSSLVDAQLRAERGPEQVRRTAGGGDRLHQPLRDRLVAPQHVVGLDAQRVTRRVRGHVGVAVAVAADPRAPVAGTRSRAVAGCRSRRVSRAAPRPQPGPRSSARSSARYSRGVTTNSDSSKNAIAVRTSSSGVGLPGPAAATCATAG